MGRSGEFWEHSGQSLANATLDNFFPALNRHRMPAACSLQQETVMNKITISADAAFIIRSVRNMPDTQRRTMYCSTPII